MTKRYRFSADDAEGKDLQRLASETAADHVLQGCTAFLALPILDQLASADDVSARARALRRLFECTLTLAYRTRAMSASAVEESDALAAGALFGLVQVTPQKEFPPPRAFRLKNEGSAVRQSLATEWAMSSRGSTDRTARTWTDTYLNNFRKFMHDVLENGEVERCYRETWPETIRTVLDTRQDVVLVASAPLTTPGGALAETLTESGQLTYANAAPPVRDGFVARLVESRALLHALTAYGAGQEPVGLTSTTALHGTGGYGKTSLASWACQHPDVVSKFPDGVCWAELGQSPTEEKLLGSLADITSMLTGRTPQRLSTLPAATAAFAAATQNRKALIVIDDVWSSADLAPFLTGSPSCRRLITTRKPGCLPQQSHRIEVAYMRPVEAGQLLSAGLPDGSDRTLLPLYERSGRWPLVLALLNGVLRSMTRRFSTPLDIVVDSLVTRMDAEGLVGLDQLSDSDTRTRSVQTTIQMSLDELAASADDTAVDRCAALACFPQGTLIPYKLIETVWGCDPVDARQTCAGLADRSLLTGITPIGVRLHDVVRDYLRRSRYHIVEAASGRLIDAARTACAYGLHEVPTAFPEMTDQLALHMITAVRDDELRTLLTDLRYHVARLVSSGPEGLRADVDMCLIAGGRDPYLGKLSQCLSLEGHLVRPTDGAQGAAGTWFARLAGHPVLADQIVPDAALLAASLTPLRPFPDVPDPRLTNVLHGHLGTVHGLSWRYDGRRIATASEDGTVRVWSEVAHQILTVQAGAPVYGVVWSPDGRLLAARQSHKIMLIDAVEGDILATTDVESASAIFAGDGTAILACTEGGLLRLSPSDLAPLTRILISARLLRPLDTRGYLAVRDEHTLTTVSTALDEEPQPGTEIDLQPIRALDVHPDGRMAVVVGSGRAALLVDTQTLATTGRSADRSVARTACAWSPDGLALAVGASDGWIDMYGAPDDAAVHFLPEDAEREAWEQQLGVTEPINYRGVVINEIHWSPDSQTLAVAAHSPVVRLWTPRVADFQPRPTRVNAVSHDPTGRLIGCGTSDGDVMLARISGPETWTRNGHGSEVQAIAWEPNGNRILSYSDECQATVWAAGPPPRALTSAILGDGWAGPVAWTPDGKIVAVSGGDIMFCDPDEDLRVVETVTMAPHITGLTVTPDARYVIAGISDEIAVHDRRSGATTHHAGHGTTVMAIRALGKRHIVSCDYQGHMFEWIVGKWKPKPLPRLFADTVWDFDITRDGVLVGAANQGAAVLRTNHRLDAGTIVRIDGTIAAASIAADGRSAAFGGTAGLYMCHIGYEM